MRQAFMVAAAKSVDDRGCLAASLELEQRIRALGCPLTELQIAPLRAGWDTPLGPLHFRSGCAPLEALADARQRIADGEDAVLIRGEDPLRSGYDRVERHRMMAIYGTDYPLTQAYTDLAEHFMPLHDLDAPRFTQLCEQLFQNYQATYSQILEQGRAPYPLPEDKWYRPVTSLFRGVDCANPMVDFHGRILLCSEALADRLQIARQSRVAVRGVGLGFLEGDGAAFAAQIAEYRHLQEAISAACEQAEIDFASAFIDRKAALEVYTCYPVVPLAFLLKSGIARLVGDLADLLKRYAVTLTGGMNLARGAWNMPALNGLITTYQHLLEGTVAIGGVHGNGGLGYRQGFAILERGAA